MITFRVNFHNLRRCEIVEVFDDGKLAAVIYPGFGDAPHTGFRVASPHLSAIDSVKHPRIEIAPDSGIQMVDFIIDPRSF